MNLVIHLVSCEKFIEIDIFWRNDSNIVKRSMFRANIEDVVGFGLLQESALFNI